MIIQEFQPSVLIEMVGLFHDFKSIVKKGTMGIVSEAIIFKLVQTEGADFGAMNGGNPPRLRSFRASLSWGI